VIIVAFRKAKTSWSPISKFISLWTRGPYCHCEFVFDLTRPRTWFGAILSGLRFTQEITGNPKKWDFVDINVNQKRIYALCLTYEGKKYDIWGILSYVLPFVKQDPRMFYCSEVIYDILADVGYLKPGIKKVDPNKLYRLLKR